MPTLYRIEVFDEDLNDWAPLALASTRATAIAIATKRPATEQARVVEFEPKQVRATNGLLIVLDEQGRVALDGMGRTGPLYQSRSRLATPPAPKAPPKSRPSTPPAEPADPIDEALFNFHRKQQGKP